MNNFNRESRSRGRGRDFDGRGSFGAGRSRERSQMHQAICSDCGKRCEVPFKPTNQKPVYCNECFQNYGGGGGRSFEKSNRGGERFQSKREGGFENRNVDMSNQCKEGLDRLIAKLDVIINILRTKEEPKEIVKEAKKSAPKKIKKETSEKTAPKNSKKKK